MNKQINGIIMWVLIIMLSPLSLSAGTYKGTINITVGEIDYVTHGYGSGYTVSGYWEDTDGDVFVITNSLYNNGGCEIRGNHVGTSTLHWFGVVSAGWDVWNDDFYWTVNVSAAPVYITINSTNFPDDNFRQYLLSQYYGEDGKLSEAEINQISELDIDNRGIENLKGIEYFTELKKLGCSSNNLQSLDLSKNTKLTTLDCSQNHDLISLNVTGCVALKSIDCWYCNLSSLNLTSVTSLTELKCGKNQLTFLDLTTNTALTSVSCSENQLTSINVSKNTALTSLDCGYNFELTSIDVSKNTNLQELDVWATKLTELDVTNNTKLTKLVCSKSSITSLDLTKNILLTYLSWEEGSLESLNLSNNNALTSLHCRENQITSLDLSNCMQLETLWCDHNQLTSLLLPNSSKLTSFWIDHNRLFGNGMDMFINSLPTNNTNEPHTFRLHLSDKGYRMTIYPGGYTDNVCTAQQVAAIKAKGWTPLYYNGGWVEYDGGYDYVIIAKDCSREYGDDNPEFEYEVSGGELMGTPLLKAYAYKTSDVGDYSIYVEQGTVQESVACMNGKLTVNKAPLTVSVEDCTKKQGEPNPDFILHYNGWKNGQDESVLTVKPAVTTMATANSPVGTYEILVTGGEAKNYTLNYVNGTLTIEVPSVINTLITEEKAVVPIYTPSGQRLAAPRKGVNIIGGRKVVVK